MTLLEVFDKISKFKETSDIALSAISTGLNVSNEFWENFILVCNNKEGVAALLGVPPEKVATWAYTIKEALNKVDNQDENPKTKLIDTGNS